MVSRKDFFKIATGETISFLQNIFSETPDTGGSGAPAPANTDDLLYEAMSLGIDPATVDASQLSDLVAQARTAAVAVDPSKD